MMEPSFYEEEERCGYQISAEMKKIWAVQLELLEAFQQVCRENGLKYVASGGTLLGAVRHQGYIPWDDDIDIAMPRADYERLAKIAPAAFKAPYFFQTPDTDRRYSRGHAQLRHSGTTAILKNELGHFPFNQGIFIDIFPLDAVPDDPAAFAAQRRRLRFYELLLDAAVRYPGNPRKTPLKTLVHTVLSLIPYRWTIRQREKTARRYNKQETQRIGMLTFMPVDNRLLFPTDGFAETKIVPFENTTIPIPAGYDAILRAQYDDYTIMKRADTYHGTILFDPSRCYQDYLR